MSVFRQPPTYKEVTVHDPQWMQWFKDLATFISNADAVTYTGSGSTVLELAPTITNANLITPSIGVATGTSLLLTGTLTAASLITGNNAAGVTSNVNMLNGAGAGAGTLLNAPAAGNPTKWIPFNDNGTVRYFPAW
jgi:hypothetical protein